MFIYCQYTQRHFCLLYYEINSVSVNLPETIYNLMVMIWFEFVDLISYNGETPYLSETSIILVSLE